VTLRAIQEDIASDAVPFPRSPITLRAGLSRAQNLLVLRTSGDGIIACMDVWLQTEGTAKGEAFSYRFVRSPQQATPMTQNSAREAVRGAKRVYPDYSWEMESGFQSGEFVVHGHKKSEGSC